MGTMLTDTWSNNLPLTESWPFCLSNYTNLPLERRAVRLVNSTLSRQKILYQPCWAQVNCTTAIAASLGRSGSTLPRRPKVAGGQQEPTIQSHCFKREIRRQCQTKYKMCTCVHGGEINRGVPFHPFWTDDLYRQFWWYSTLSHLYFVVSTS